MPVLKGYRQARPGACEERISTMRSSRSSGVNNSQGKSLPHPDCGCNENNKARQGPSRWKWQWVDDTRRTRKVCSPTRNRR
ncbi:hypothetical protein PanWU01x14_034730 [Parasponia andersonii]|uniref:Uncharacterized protein n=1 Tax=Parasponia andersonii TaxID=3476 RepID=A0A2P5DT21_PARAD|nr:hypothetical protein PanWU01x14_034730 [Parasponia andersonii]